ncbi:hypothetical protein ACFL0H_10610 [Thermodesulfobacteriota bacterium]
MGMTVWNWEFLLSLLPCRVTLGLTAGPFIVVVLDEEIERFPTEDFYAVSP